MGEQSPRQSLAFAAASGLVSLVPIGRAGRRVKVALSAASGATAGVAGFVVLRRQPLPVPQAALIGAGMAGAVAGATALGIVMDRAFEEALVRRGVRRPRLAMGVAAVGLSYVLDVLDRRVSSSD